MVEVDNVWQTVGGTENVISVAVEQNVTHGVQSSLVRFSLIIHDLVEEINNKLNDLSVHSVAWA